MHQSLLEVKIVDGVFKISIGVETILNITKPEIEEVYGDVNIIDISAFADEVLDQLKREQEDGTTPVHELFYNAFSSAIDDGAEGIEIEDA